MTHLADSVVSGLLVFLASLAALAFGLALLRALIGAIHTAIDDAVAIVTQVLFIMIVPLVWAWEKGRRWARAHADLAKE